MSKMRLQPIPLNALEGTIKATVSSDLNIMNKRIFPGDLHCLC